MLDKQIRELGELPFARMITPLKTLSSFPGAIVGFDTESVSATGEYLCTQLSYQGEAKLYDKYNKLTVDRLASYVRDIGVDDNQALLVSYASWAELQFLPVKTEAFNWKEYGGSFDCSFYSDRHRLAIRVFDLARFFERSRLADVAEAFGYKKLDWDTSRVVRSMLRNPRFRKYAVNDAVITEAIFRDLRAEFLQYGVDIAVTNTPARTAATVFRSQYLKKELANHENRARYAGMRAAWGGRAEAFRRGHFSMLYEYDLPSAYPNAGIHYSALPTTKDWREITSTRGIDKWRGGFANVIFEFPAAEQYPCLPQVDSNSQLYFSAGKEWVTLAELSYALSLGAKIQIVEAWGFMTGDATLSGFLEDALKQREKAVGVKKIAAKLLANSLIGKLNQRTHGIDIEEIRKLAIRQRMSIEELMSMRAEELEALGANSSISVGSCYMPEYNALITGLTRMRISQMVRDFEAVYCATDSIWVRRPIAKSRLPYGATLKRQGEGDVFRTRLGRIGEHIVHHAIGTRDAARELFDAYLKDGTETMSYEKRRPRKLREALRSRRTIGQWFSETRMASLAWDDKRHLLTDGTTLPFYDAAERKVFLDEKRARLRQQRKSRAR